MPTEIDIRQGYAVEQSTAKITVNFTDEDGVAVIPTSIIWTLTDSSGSVVNSRLNVSVVTPAAEIEIGLTGDDLALLAGETGDSVNRIFTVEAVYNSDLGSDLTLKDSLKFPLVNLVAVS